MTYRTYHNETTRSSVLRAVADTDNAVAWERFFDLYAGFVFAFARSKGLSADDADDLVQVVFADLSRTLPTFDYDRNKGKFRSYLLKLVNWRLADKLNSVKRDESLKADYWNEIKVANSRGSDSALADRKWQEAALKEALRRLQPEIRPDHFAAFVESTVEGLDVETVMKLHNLTRDNLYQIRTRLTAKLKPLVAAVLAEMDEGRF